MRTGTSLKVRIVGGGPAGLLFAYLMKRHNERHDVVVFERGLEDSTYGWGVVFSDVALAAVRAIAPELFESLTQNQVISRNVSVVHKGSSIALRHTFHRMARIELLRVLHAYGRKVGVGIDFDCEIDDIAEFSDADLIVAADGAGSAIRSKYGEYFQPIIDERPNWMAWFGTTCLFEPLSLIFQQNHDGLVIAHAYQYSPSHSTFLVEVNPATFNQAGLADMTEIQSLGYCERVFAEHLNGHVLLSNRSAWFRYSIVKNRHWHFRNVVLLGDALRTGHPSIGSGTGMALQDAIALFDAHKRCGSNVQSLLSEFVARRRPGSDALQEAAIRSTQWYESLGPKLCLDPVSFAYDYLRRTGRVEHSDIRMRDPELAAAYERLHPNLIFS
jgi:2-polyprenyl-6-methoxyphenol hydroxylase-like FAD-dependent oxidoreductase